jgi:rubrerythrin
MSDLQTSLSALKLALKTEEEGYRLYKSGAEQSKNEFVRSIFQQLSKDELMHINLIKRFYAELNQSGSWIKMSAEEKNYKGIKGEIKTIFSQTLEKVKSGKETISDTDLKVYQQAIDFEKNGVKMYSQLYQETSDSTAQKFYAFLRDMEQEHADTLDNTYQYLKDPDSWYMQKEGWTMDY